EELWQNGSGATSEPLILADWPQLDGLADEAASAEMDWVIRCVGAIRSVRSEINIPAGAKVALVVTGANGETARRVESHAETLTRMARLKSLDVTDKVPAGSVQIVLDEATLALVLKGVIDISEETERLEKAIAKTEAEIAGIDKKLANENFTSRAPQEVVEAQRQRGAEAKLSRDKLQNALSRLQQLG
ncbi:MAG: valine--tRNA ligase, partial [Hyphomicrobiales bacterium]